MVENKVILNMRKIQARPYDKGNISLIFSFILVRFLLGLKQITFLQFFYCLLINNF